MNIEERIAELNNEDLDRLLRCLNFALSGAEVGEAATFQLIADIEVIAMSEQSRRNNSLDDLLQQLAGIL